jgi:xanthine dehydrogenase YagR molybdenum-binding subunit
MHKIIESKTIGTDLRRLDGVAKLQGSARYAFDQEVDNPSYLYPVQARITRGKISRIDTSQAESLAGVIVVITHLNAPKLAKTDDAEYAVLQGTEIGFRGQFVAAVIAETPEIARHGASLVDVKYDVADHDALFSPEHPGLYAPQEVNGGFKTDTNTGDVDAALAGSPIIIDNTYQTPTEHNNPMEPHATVALWDGEGFLLYDSTQGVHPVRQSIAEIFGLDPALVRVIAPHVGGGFGAKGMPHAHVVLAALGAQCNNGRPVKFALTRQQMFSLAGYRTPTIQHVRLGAQQDGRLTAIWQDAVGQTSKIKEYAEQTAVPARMMYAAPNRRTTHRLAPLDVPIPSWMRGPGECPGMFGPEVAMDELAVACGLDPIELRVRNEPEFDPESGKPFSSRHLLECLSQGAQRFGWKQRAAPPRSRLEDGWFIGLGVASATYPFTRNPGNSARIVLDEQGNYEVHIGAADLGTGTWTTLTQIAADALSVGVDRIRLQIGDSSLPVASVAGGSSGTASWGGTIIAAAEAFAKEHGPNPQAGAQTEAKAPQDPDAEQFAMHSFGAQFAEARVHADTGEVRVSRMLGVFSAGRIINPRTARSQFIGGMTMGIGMALHEETLMDERFGSFMNHDLAEYHIPTNADIEDVDAIWLQEVDQRAGRLGARGIGEIGIVGAAAAIANATYNATGIRVRDLPLSADKFLV